MFTYFLHNTWTLSLNVSYKGVIYSTLEQQQTSNSVQFCK